MSDKTSQQRLQAIRNAFEQLRKRYVYLLVIVGVIVVSGQFFIQKKLSQIGITYEALNEIQQIYDVGSLLQPKGLMIAVTTGDDERKKHISDFSKQIDIYLALYSQMRYNTEYHDVFAVSDTVRQRIFRLDRETSEIRRELPIYADSISIDTTFVRIANILSSHNQSAQELNVFIMGYRQELQQMRIFLQWMSFSLIGLLVIAAVGEVYFILIPSRKTAQRLFSEAEESQKELAAALKNVSNTRSRYELLVKQAQECVYQLDARGRFLFANDAAMKLLGYDSAMLAETYYLDYVHPEYKRTVMVEYLRQDSAEYSDNMTFPIIDAEGKTRWIEQSFSKLYDNGMFVGYLGIGRDITERREIQQSFAELATLHGLVLENTTTVVITTDMEGSITLFNQAAEYLLGYEAEEVIGKMSILDLHSQDELSEKMRSTTKAFGIDIHGPLQMLFINAQNYGKYLQSGKVQTKHGSIIPVEQRLRLLQDSEGNIKGLLMTAQDMSEKQQVEQIKQEFISRVSHEMRTPLHGIIGMVEILRASELNEEQRSILEIAQSKADVLLTLINDILEYSKIQSGTLEIQRVDYDMALLLSNITEVLQHRLFTKGIEIEIELSTNMPTHIYCDPVRLYQIILNLSDNLIQFTNGGKLHITFDYAEKTDARHLSKGLYISLYIIDGLINSDVQRKVFTPFLEEFSEQQTFHPTGLQLTLLRGIVQQMGGLLWLEQNANTGSTFHIYLTIDKELQAEMSHLQEIVEQNGHQQSSSQELGDSSKDISSKSLRHILIVDDDEDNRSLAHTYLEGSQKYSFETSFAINGVEAVTAVQANHFDAILMDIQMPIMDGFDATRAIRYIEQKEQRTRTPIVAITAHVMENYRDKCLNAGLSDYLPKPVKKYQLLDMVHKWLEQRKTILLVDDSDDFRLVMQLQFEKENKYNIIVASNGQEAIDIFKEQDIDAIIMDVEMPTLNGYEATRILRQMPKGHNIPIYAMTGHFGGKEMERTLEVGCNECFSKNGLDSVRQVIKAVNSYFEKEQINTMLQTA